MQGQVLITGAAGALGRSVVRRFLEAGERVLAVDHQEGSLTSLQEAIPSAALSVRAVDLTSTREVEGLFAVLNAEGSSKPLTAVHLVGGFRFARFRDMTDEDWRFLLDLNLETTFRIFRDCARRFERDGGGVLVAVASPAGLLGEAGVGGYAAAKAGVLRMVDSLAREVGPSGARVNSVLPGTMDTPANRAAMPQADRGRWVTTDTVAEVIHYLTTAQAAAVNGAAVRVPGGDL